MKRVFRMIGEGEDNITAFDFDTYMIKKDAVCIFKPCKDFTIKVTWREGSHVMKALADADGGFICVDDETDRIWFTFDPEFKDALLEAVLENRKNAGKILDTPFPEDDDEDDEDDENVKDDEEYDLNGDSDWDSDDGISWDE